MAEGENIIVGAHYPDTFQYITFAFTEANLGLTESSLLWFNDAGRDAVVDAITIYTDTADAQFKVDVKVIGFNTGTPPIADNVDSAGDIVATNTGASAMGRVDMTIDTTKNVVGEGKALAIAFSDSSTATVDTCFVQIRLRTRRM